MLGIEPNELRLEDGLSMIYGSCISWVSPTKPATKEIYPVARLRPAGRRRQRPQARPQHPRRGAGRIRTSLQPKISSGDRKKLDEYLESIRDIEKRIDRAGKEERLEGWRPTLEQAEHAAPDERAAAERAGSHEADARPDRARVPDGQDAHRDAACSTTICRR